MKILGIDPGYGRLGIAVLEKNPQKDLLLFSDCIETSPKDSFEKRLVEIGNAVSQIIKTYQPEVLAIEALFFSNNKKTAMQVAEARGVILYEAQKNGLKIFEYQPGAVKIAVTGHGSSDKKQIMHMIPLLVSMKKTKLLDDEYDAIALAITHSATSNLIHKHSLLAK